MRCLCPPKEGLPWCLWGYASIKVHIDGLLLGRKDQWTTMVLPDDRQGNNEITKVPVGNWALEMYSSSLGR